jgi:fucose permease
MGSLIAWPCLLYRSFGGFCAAIFVIGNGLGSLETAANPYLAGTLRCRENHCFMSNKVQYADRQSTLRFESTSRRLSMASEP